MQKIYNAQGVKARQREDNEDRSLVYRDWIRTVNTGGLFIDIDFVKWKNNKDGKLMPVAITDITRCDKENIEESYRDAILERLFQRDKQGELLETLGNLLRIPVYLVLFQKEMKWLWVYSFRKNYWREFTPNNWALYLKGL